MSPTGWNIAHVALETSCLPPLEAHWDSLGVEKEVCAVVHAVSLTPSSNPEDGAMGALLSRGECIDLPVCFARASTAPKFALLANRTALSMAETSSWSR